MFCVKQKPVSTDDRAFRRAKKAVNTPLYAFARLKRGGRVLAHGRGLGSAAMVTSPLGHICHGIVTVLPLSCNGIRVL